MTTTKTALPRSAMVSTVLSCVAVLIGLVAVIIFAPLDGGFPSVLSTLGTTLLTIGIVSFTSEHLLRRALTQDLLKKIGLQQRLHNAGLDDVESWAQYSSANSFGESRSNVIVALRPTSMVERLWPEIERVCATTNSVFDIYFPNPESSSFSALADRLNVSSDVYKQQVETAFSDLQRKWQRSARSKRVLHEKAELNIHLVDDDLGHSVIATDSSFVLIVEPFNPRDGGEDPIVFRFRRRDELAERATWLRDSVADLTRRKHTPDWSAAGRPKDDTKEIAN